MCWKKENLERVTENEKEKERENKRLLEGKKNLTLEDWTGRDHTGQLKFPHRVKSYTSDSCHLGGGSFVCYCTMWCPTKDPLWLQDTLSRESLVVSVQVLYDIYIYGRYADRDYLLCQNTHVHTCTNYIWLIEGLKWVCKSLSPPPKVWITQVKVTHDDAISSIS